jgi:hypothetical protein
MKTLWSGHVQIELDDGGETHINYLADGESGEHARLYTPNGFFEHKAVRGLVDKLSGAPEPPA